MIEVKNVLEVINKMIVLPMAIITFFLLIYMVIYLWKKDPDVIRSRIFLKYHEIKKAFLLLSLFAFVLIPHVLLIYFAHFFLWDFSFSIYFIQRMFGLILIFILVSFVYHIYKSIKDSGFENN